MAKWGSETGFGWLGVPPGLIRRAGRAVKRATTTAGLLQGDDAQGFPETGVNNADSPLLETDMIVSFGSGDPNRSAMVCSDASAISVTHAVVP